MKLIRLTQNQFAQVDDSDYESLNQYKWYAIKDNTYYAVRYSKEKNKIIQMHREIMQTPRSLIVDHRDHNGLNNQRYNLRNCTIAENHRNRIGRGKSQYKGICCLNNRSSNGKNE
jgi:hypothetical protein